MSYSTLMSNIWPPPNEETLTRLQRLKELKELREKREVTGSVTGSGSSSVEGSRLSRRHLLTTNKLPTNRLKDRQEERLRATQAQRASSNLERNTTNLLFSHSQSYDSLDKTTGYGGARPKNFSAMQNMAKEPGSSEILASIRRTDKPGFLQKSVERSSSIESDTFDDQKSPMLNSKNSGQSKRITSTGSLGNLADELETDFKAHDTSIESDNVDHIEDIETFKQSLYGTNSQNTSTDRKGNVLTPFSYTSDVFNSTSQTRYGLSFSSSPGTSGYDAKEGLKRIDDLFGGGSKKPESVHSFQFRNRDSARWRKNINEDTSKLSKVSENIKKDKSVDSSSVPSAVINERNSEVCVASENEGVNIQRTNVELNYETQQTKDPLHQTDKSTTELSKQTEISGKADSKPDLDKNFDSIEPSPAKVDSDFSNTNHKDIVIHSPNSKIIENRIADRNNDMKCSDTKEITREKVFVTDGEKMLVQDRRENGQYDMPADLSEHSVSKQDESFSDICTTENIEGNTEETLEMESNETKTIYKADTENVSDKNSRGADKYRYRSYSETESWQNEHEEESHTLANVKDSILSETDSIFDYSNKYSQEKQTFEDHWKKEQNVFSRVSGYAPKYSRRDRLVTSQPRSTTRITRYASLPNSSDPRISEFRSRYLNRDSESNYTSEYFTSEPATSSFTGSERQYEGSITSRLGNILNDSFKKIDTALGGEKENNENVDTRRNITRRHSYKSEPTDDFVYHSKYRRYSNQGNESRSDINSDDREQNSVPNVHEFISSIRNRNSDDKNYVSRLTAKPPSGKRSVIENARRVLLGIRGDEEIGMLSKHSEDSFQLNEETSKLTSDNTEKESTLLNLDGSVSEASEDSHLNEQVSSTSEITLETGKTVHLSLDSKMEKENSDSVPNQSEVEDQTQMNESDNVVHVVEKTESKVTVNQSEQAKEDSTVNIESSSQSSESVQTTPKQTSAKNKNKKKKKGKKKKNSDIPVTHNKDTNTTKEDTNEQRNITVEQNDENITITYKEKNFSENNSNPTENFGTVQTKFETLISDIDHTSEKTSVATEDLLSLSNGDKSSDKISLNSQDTQCNSTSTKELTSGSSFGTESRITDDRFATFEGEDLIEHSEPLVMSQTGFCLPNEMEHFETASEEEEFYEAVPGELAVNEKDENTYTDHKEQFIYVTSGSKVRKRKISKKSLLVNTENIEDAKQTAEANSRIGQVKDWMENNIFPSNVEIDEKDIGVKSSDCGSRFSVESTVGDIDSRESINSAETFLGIKNRSAISSVTSKGSTLVDKVNSSFQTDLSLLQLRNNSTQTSVKSWNIGIQVDYTTSDKSAQTLFEMICPCCRQQFSHKDIMKEFSSEVQGRQITTESKLYKESESFSNGFKMEELNLKLNLQGINTEEGSEKKKTSLNTSKKYSTSSSPEHSSHSSTTPSVNTSLNSDANNRSTTSSKLSASTPKKNLSIFQRNDKQKSPNTTPRLKHSNQKSPSVTPRQMSPTRKSPSVTPRQQSPSRKSPSATPRQQSPNRKSPSTTPRQQSPSRKSPSVTPKQQSPSVTPRKQSPSRLSAPKKTPQTSINGVSKTNGDNKIAAKTRKEKVANVKELLYQNGENNSADNRQSRKKPAMSSKSRSRDPSAEKGKGDGDVFSDKNELPSYMQPTRSSSRKKSMGKADLVEENKKRKSSPSPHGRRNFNRDENGEGFTTMNDNPGGNSETSNVWQKGKESKESGKWYRKEPLPEEKKKNSKVRTPKKSRSQSASSCESSSSRVSVNSNSKISGKKKEMLNSVEKLDIRSVGSRSSLLETDLDATVEPVSDRSESSRGSDVMHETFEVFPIESSSLYKGQDIQSYAEKVSKSIAEMEVKKLQKSDNLQKDSAKSQSLNSLTETEVRENVSGNVEERKEDSGTAKDEIDCGGKQKILSDEEEVGVPVVTEDGGDEVAPVRVNLSNWDPTKLLKDLYTIKLLPDNAEDISHKFIGMEGLMEKLPMNKKKATLLKTWKRRFFKAKDGWLYYFETGNHDKPSDTLQLMGGKVDDLGNRILGIDDGRGKYLMVRCPTDKEYGQWKLALESQTADNVKATYVRPVMSAPPHSQKKVIVIDIGSSSIRAGLLSENATLPQVFFPTSVAHIEGSDELVVGIEAYEPEHRKKSTKPIHPTDKLDKFSIDMSTIGAVFKKIFTDLKLESSDYWVMISTPQNLADKIRSGLMEILIAQFHVQGVCMVMQALLALYSYNATSGIIVDIGERMEILPIYDGFIIEGGVSRQSYGGQKVAESLNSCLHGYKFSTPIQQLIVRYVMEQSCYLALDYKDTVKKCESDPESYRTTVYLTNYNLPEGANVDVTHDYSCFQSPEGFFNTDLWGMDYPCVHKLVFQAIQSCPIDSRKRMYRAVYLSGGTTMLPGFAERLQMELQKLAPPSVMVEVHASPQRYHSAYIGACSLANMEQFKQICISAEEWKKEGTKAFKKWNMSG